MTIVFFLFCLGILILIHELGHFLGAKKVGILVEEFAIGFPPRILSKKIKETVYSIGIILFGGFIKLRGENDPNDPQGFLNLKPIKRLIIILAGVFFNFLLAYFLFVLSLNFGYPTETEKIFVAGFLNENTQAFKYFRLGDEITKVKLDDRIYQFNDLLKLSQFLKEHRGKELEIFYLRNNQEFSVKVIPPIGFYLANFKLEKKPFIYSLFLGWEKTFSAYKKITVGFLEAIKSLITKEKINLEIVGPIGIYNLFDNFKNFGLGYLFYFLAILSLNLVFINSLPFPALDGGRALFILFEMISGKKLNYRKEELIHQIGLAFLFSLLILVTLKDIFKLWSK